MNNLRRFVVAPMVDYTNKDYRYLLRLISKDVYLFTEMIAANAIKHGDLNKILNYDTSEHPLALQIGGNETEAMLYAGIMGEEYGYKEININLGCPSPAVQKGAFGAIMMKEPIKTADLIYQLIKNIKIPVTVKCRLGVDEFDNFEYFKDFIVKLKDAGVQVFYIHARKAWLNGLSPKENRTIPPLNYNFVYEIKKMFPKLEIILNGGLDNFYPQQMLNLDGVMLGRAVIKNPWILQSIDAKPLSKLQVILEYLDYIDKQNPKHIASISRHMANLATGLPNCKQFKAKVCDPKSTLAQIKDLAYTYFDT